LDPDFYRRPAVKLPQGKIRKFQTVFKGCKVYLMLDIREKRNKIHEGK
jgi:hypothetical protein